MRGFLRGRRGSASPPGSWFRRCVGFGTIQCADECVLLSQCYTLLKNLKLRKG